MASHSGDRSVHNKTLVGGTADVVTLSADFTQVRVINLDGAAAIYFTVDQPSAPIAGADGTFVLPAAISSRVEASRATQGTVVRLISGGTPAYSVEGV